MNNHLPNIVKAVDYIENHIKENLNMGDVASYVGFSKFHFTRVFKDVTGYNPYDYYRGRKLTKAIYYMQDTNCKIIDAAFEYGFNSPEVFTRSCLSVFGSSPSQIRKLILSNTFEGIKELEEHQLYRYQDYDNVDIQSASLPTLLLKGYAYSTHDFFEKIDMSNDLVGSLFNDTETLYHLHVIDSQNPHLFHHFVGTTATLESITQSTDLSSFVYKQIPESQYLIFPLIKDGKELESMKDYIYEYYLPQKEYVSDKLYHLEAIRLNKDKTIQNSMLYIPADRKKRRT